jgi:2-oxoisovalerate dehydrogenase E2 component (dihydrolipoyl transacylase)
VTGTGVDGAITREDVLRAVSGGGSAGAGTRHESPVRAEPSVRAGRAEPIVRTVPTVPSDTRIPVTGVRKQTAAAMVSSASTAPHASVFLTVDVTPTLDLLADLQTDRAFAGRHLTVLTLVAKAVLVALTRHPALNAHWEEGEIVQHAHVGLGIAVAAPRGLLVPVVHDAGRLHLPELADAIRDVAETARAGTTAPADLAGGTITITNIGVFGVDGGTPILVPGQAAIVAMGAVRRQPWEFQDEIALRHVMTLGMSFDHRQVDGAEAAQFLHDVGTILARPGAVLAMV